MRVLLIENLGEDFYKSRVPFAKHMMEEGHEVFALVPEDGYCKQISAEGVKVISYPFSRKNKGLLQILRLVFFYRKIIIERRIDLIHSFRFQPNLISTLANLLTHRKVILHITGLGVAFSINSFKYRIFRIISRLIYVLKFLRADKVIVQNPDDINDFIAHEYFKSKIHLIRGSGVDVNYFAPLPFNEVSGTKDGGKLKFVCITRLLWEKGIHEMTDAFLNLPKEIQEKVELNIVGWADFENPRAVDMKYIDSFSDCRFITFSGRKSNILEILRESTIYIYPSYYREGIPRGLLEALAVGLPIITTNMPGCNLTVDDGQNGYLIEPRSVNSILEVVIRVVNGYDSLLQMGVLSRTKAVNEFSSSRIYGEIGALYENS